MSEPATEAGRRMLGAEPDDKGFGNIPRRVNWRLRREDILAIEQEARADLAAAIVAAVTSLKEENARGFATPNECYRWVDRALEDVLDAVDDAIREAAK